MIKATFEYTRNVIMHILGMTEEQYHLHVFETAYEAIEAGHFMDTESMLKRLPLLPAFWEKWVLQWNLRNKTFYETYMQNLPEADLFCEAITLRAIYEETHKPTNITVPVGTEITKELVELIKTEKK